MALEEEFNEPVLHFAFDEDIPLKQKGTSIPASTTGSVNANECFDCNICLESANDPVVTLCGHLYCWPCIYKWLQVQNSSLESNEQPKCPVCKAHISNSTLIPLYGRGKSSSVFERKQAEQDFSVPDRPQALGLNTLPTAVTPVTPVTSRANRRRPPNLAPLQSGSYRQQLSYASIAEPSLGGSPMTSIYSPTVSMFGEMVFARLFGNEGNMMTYPYPNTYPYYPGSGSPRIRRLELQVDKSLSRVSIFLFCCIVLCLLLF